MASTGEGHDIEMEGVGDSRDVINEGDGVADGSLYHVVMSRSPVSTSIPATNNDAVDGSPT